MSPPKARSKKQYSEHDMVQAVNDVKSNLMSAYGASNKYKVPVSTLRDRLKGVHSKSYGAEKVLSDVEESQLAEWVILCARSGFPKSKTQILKTAGALAKLHSTKKFLRETPTSGWFKKFAKRHPEISKRTPELLGKSSALITPEVLKNYFSLVESQFEKSGRSELLNKPESWWNIDETGFEMNPAPNKVYAAKGAKNVHIVERGKSKENITCTYAVCGDGRYIPPLVTFKGSFSNLDLAAYVSKDVEANFGFNHTESGWMKGEAFYYFVTEHLYPRWIQMGVEFPVVLVIDGYSAHKSPDLFIWCKQHDVILLLLYPNSTHIIQVLDVAIFGPLKVKYRDLYEDWKTLYPSETFSELEFIKVIKATNDSVIKSATIINGWRATGLQPFNFSNINLQKLLTKDSTNQDDHGTRQKPTTINSPTTEPILVVRDGVEYVLSDDNFIFQPDEWKELENENQLECENQFMIDNQQENESQQFEVQNTNASLMTNENPYMQVDGATFDIRPSTSFAALHENVGETSTSIHSNGNLCDEATGSTTGTSFAALHNDIGLFANNFNDTYPDGSFGLNENECLDNSVQSTSGAAKKLKTLVDKARQAIRQVGMHVKVHDPPKMLNILVMAQQLNILEPVNPVVEIVPAITPQSVEDILKVPTIARKTKRTRNKKLSFGVMSDVEIVNAIGRLAESDKAQDRESEADKLAEIQRAKEIDELEKSLKEEQNSIQEKREKLKSLKIQNAAEKKESAKRKLSGNIQKKQRNGKQLKEAKATSLDSEQKRKK